MIQLPQFDPQRREAANSLRLERGIENALTPSQARLFVRCLQISWQVPPINWSERESQAQYDDAIRLMHAGDIFAEIDGRDSAEAVECYRRAAEIFEWLARTHDNLTQLVPLEFYAAGCYQLGGLPAMATSLLKKIDDGEAKGKIYASFLSADFDGVLGRVAAFWRENLELTGRLGTSAILNGEADDGLSWYIVVELIRCLGLISDSMRKGNPERLNVALRKLKAIKSLSLRTVGEEAWMLLSLLETAATRFAASSIYARVHPLANNAPLFLPRLNTFAREQFSRGRGILWTSQIHGLDKLIQTSSFALCTPTGSGKTLIANLALIKELLLRPAGELAPLALYLVPSRALAGEVEAKLTAELGRDFTVTGLYGGADWGITDFWISSDQPVVLISTVEKAEALLRYLGPLLLTRLRFMLIDEAHQVVSDNDQNAVFALSDHVSRPIRLESLVSRVIAIKPEISRVALTAVAGGAAGPVARWMEGNPNAAPIGTRYRSARQLVGALLATPQQSGRIVLDIMNGRPLYVRGRDDAVYLPLRIPPMPQTVSRIRDSLNHYNEINVLWTALHLIEGNRRILISVAQEPEVTMRWYVEAFSLAGWGDLATFPEPDDPDARIRLNDARACCIDYCGPNSYELALLNHGIATSHGQMPQRLRRLMTDLIERRICPITVATATLTEGVNLPFDIIFVTELTRSSYDPILQTPIVVPISTSEFRNLAGRAGRPGAAEGIEGMTLVALPQSPSTTAASKRDTQRIQVQRLDRAYQDLLNRLALDENPDARVQSPLALLITSIAQRAASLFGLDQEGFLRWLETALPENLSADAGSQGRLPTTILANCLDELDGLLLSSIEELANIRAIALSPADAEAHLRALWTQTFARVAQAQEAYLEAAFIRRGRAIVETVYPDAVNRAWSTGDRLV